MTAITAPREAIRRRRAASERGGESRLGRGGPVTYAVAVLFVGICIAPVLYIIIGGFRTNSQITTDPSGLPDPWVVENYLEVLANPVFWRQIGNSTIAAVFTTAGVVVLGVMASYVLARYDFRGRGAMYSLFAAGLMFPITVAITPLYILVRNLGMMNSLTGIIVPQIAFALPTTVIILVPFLRAIPRELEEAAAIDGAGRLGFFFRMVVPLSVPGVVTVGILAFIASWNSYLLPLFILNNEASYTLPLGVQAFSSEYSVDTARVLAFTSLSMIPALIFFSFFEKRIVGGLTGAVKG
ncbi:carbohydrate ABC transporter permease [uncultured Georgenia sp.]|uniref:carbohydrate ABC transporter permease n=1 Tax=uncultured Georgenia sp. TaxID=378209 RepID=UPI002615DE05|nr:carbohydrate ABC transporter permease [uncultured Georgenia sp.]HLV04289.1 carbohydrate ABC transporter permease [Actinomycetaceae bacterium]